MDSDKNLIKSSIDLAAAGMRDLGLHSSKNEWLTFYSINEAFKKMCFENKIETKTEKRCYQALLLMSAEPDTQMTWWDKIMNLDKYLTPEAGKRKASPAKNRAELFFQHKHSPMRLTSRQSNAIPPSNISSTDPVALAESQELSIILNGGAKKQSKFTASVIGGMQNNSFSHILHSTNHHDQSCLSTSNNATNLFTSPITSHKKVNGQHNNLQSSVRFTDDNRDKHTAVTRRLELDEYRPSDHVGDESIQEIESDIEHTSKLINQMEYKLAHQLKIPEAPQPPASSMSFRDQLLQQQSQAQSQSHSQFQFQAQNQRDSTKMSSSEHGTGVDDYHLLHGTPKLSVPAPSAPAPPSTIQLPSGKGGAAGFDSPLVHGSKAISGGERYTAYNPAGIETPVVGHLQQQQQQQQQQYPKTAPDETIPATAVQDENDVNGDAVGLVAAGSGIRDDNGGANGVESDLGLRDFSSRVKSSHVLRKYLKRDPMQKSSPQLASPLHSSSAETTTTESRQQQHHSSNRNDSLYLSELQQTPASPPPQGVRYNDRDDQRHRRRAHSSNEEEAEDGLSFPPPPQSHNGTSQSVRGEGGRGLSLERSSTLRSHDSTQSRTPRRASFPDVASGGNNSGGRNHKNISNVMGMTSPLGSPKGAAAAEAVRASTTAAVKKIYTGRQVML